MTSCGDNGAEANVNRDEEILAQKAQIEADIRKSTKLIGDLEEISSVEKEFENDQVYEAKVKSLAAKYNHIRRTRPDGNCFFRAVAFAYFEKLLGGPAEVVEGFRKVVEPSKDAMIKLGFTAFTVEDFYDNFMDQVGKIGKLSMNGRKDEGLEALLETFNNEGTSDYLVVFLRLLTSMHLRSKADFYQDFLEGDHQTVDNFCSLNVEPMYQESDHIHVTALTKETGIKVRVVYLDRGSNKEPSTHDFSESHEKPDVILLYRPGHYDILYPTK